MEPPSFSSVFHSVHDFISNYNHFMGSFASAPRGIDAPKGAGRFAPMWSRRITSVHWQGTDPLHIEAEQDNIPILDHIFLALGADQALFPGSGHGAAGHQILIGHHLGPDEAPLKVGVDLTGGLRGLGPLFDGPGPALVLAGGEVGDQTQQGIAGLPPDRPGTFSSPRRPAQRSPPPAWRTRG